MKAMHNILLFFFGSLFTAGFAVWAYRFSRELLAGTAILLPVLANLFVLKQINLFGLNATATDILTVGSCFAVNLFHEAYGKEAAIRLIQAMLMALAFTAVIAQVMLWYEPSTHDYMHDVYYQLLSVSHRIFGTSLLVFYISQRLNIGLYRLIRDRFSTLSLPIVNIVALGLTQLVDTALFTTLALQGIASEVFQIFCISYSVKLASIILFVPFSGLVLKHKAAEHV